MTAPPEFLAMLDLEDLDAHSRLRGLTVSEPGADTTVQISEGLTVLITLRLRLRHVLCPALLDPELAARIRGMGLDLRAARENEGSVSASAVTDGNGFVPAQTLTPEDTDALLELLGLPRERGTVVW